MNTEELKQIRQIIREEIRSANSEYLNIQEAAKFTTLSTSTIYTYVNRRQIPHLKRDGRVIFKKAALAAWLEEVQCTPKREGNRRLGNVVVRI